MLNRSLAPSLSIIEKIDYIKPEVFQLNEHCELLWMKDVKDDSVKVDLVFQAGKLMGDKIVTSLTGNLLLSGTSNKNSVAISEAIDLLGGFVHVEVGPEESVVSIFGLKQNIWELLQLVYDFICEVNFNEKEFLQEIQTAKQRLLISLEKVSTIARREFIKRLLVNTGYSNLTQIDDFDNIQRNQLIEFHKSFYLSGLKQICVVGNVSTQMVDALIKLMDPIKATTIKSFNFDFVNQPQKKVIPKDNAVQSALRVGRILFNRNHPDYIGFSVLNTILGGYFGSRLMSNIREDKGYTYGIGSGVVNLKDSGYFFISTEVGKNVAEKSLFEIQLEMEKLNSENIHESELKIVRNYSIGKLLKGADGPYALLDRYLAVKRFGLDLNYYNQVIETIQTITPEQLKQLARKYLDWDKMVIVQAG